MAGETTLTIVGNLCGDPEIRFTPNGKAVANFTVASTPRTFNKDTQKWDDGDALFMRCDAWNQLAENIAESLSKGTRVVVMGRLRQENWEDKETGAKKSGFKMTVDAIGPDLTWSTAKVQKADRSGGGNSGGGNSFGGNTADPWATAATPAAGGFADEPPF